MQSKKESMVETLTNVGIGWFISFIANMLVLPLFGYNINLTDGVLISIIFTIISIVRGYLIRRFFNSKERKYDVD